MKTFLLIASCLGVALAGVGHLSPSEEADILHLFEKLCNGYGSEGQDIGWTRVYCKRGSGEITETKHHQVNVPGSSGQAQTVFVQPPPARYHHKVEVISGGGQGGQTKIYVLPQTATHHVTPKVQTHPGTQVKPVVYFLKGGSSSGYGPPSKVPPPSHHYEISPPSSYGPPAKQQPPSQGYGHPPPPPPPPPTKPPHGYGPPSKLPSSPSYGVPIDIVSDSYGR